MTADFASALVLHVLPGLAGQLALCPLTSPAIFLAGAQVVAEQHHPLDLGAVPRENVQVDIPGRRFEQPVLVPLGLADTQDVAGVRQGGDVTELIGGVVDDQHDVHDRFGHQAWDGCRTRVLDPERPIPHRQPDPLGLAQVEPGPGGVVLDQLDRARQRDQFADGDGPELLLVQAFTARSRSTSLRRRILPEADFGISSIVSTSRIFLWGATRSATNAISSSGATGDLSTTNALGTSPASSSGCGITAASATAGCVSRRASSSAGGTWYPLYLISSFSRSTT